MGVQHHRRRGAGSRRTDLEYIVSTEKGPELDRLPAQQRLLLLLRYEQGLTLRKIAELLNLGDPFRARREIEAALDALARTLQLAASR